MVKFEKDIDGPYILATYENDTAYVYFNGTTNEIKQLLIALIDVLIDVNKDSSN